MKPYALVVLSISMLQLSLAVPASAQLHASVLPIESEFLVDRWNTFYATLLNDSDIDATYCTVRAQDPNTYDVVSVLTNPTNNSPRSIKNPIATIPAGTHVTYRIRVRNRLENVFVDDRIYFEFGCLGESPAASVERLNVVLVSSVIESETAEDVLSRIGCVEKRSSFHSSVRKCFQDTNPSSLAIRESHHSSSYFFCYEDSDGLVESMYAVLDSKNGLSAHECRITKANVGCNIQHGLSLWVGGSFTGGKAGASCSYPRDEHMDDDRRIVEAIYKDRPGGDKRAAICDVTRCRWELLDHSDINELIR